MILMSAQAFPPRSGGIQTLMDGFARAAAKKNEVVVYADGDRRAAAYDQEATAPYTVRRFSGLKQWRRRNKASAIKRFCQENTVSHIVCDSWKSAELLSTDIDVPILIYAHGNEFPKDPNSSKTARIMRSLEKADHIISVSSQTALRVQAYLPHSGGPKLHVRPNPVSEPDPATDADKAFADALWPATGIRLLALCRLIDWKGIDTAVTALRQLHLKDVEAQMVIAGAGPDLERLKEIVESSGLSGHVEFAGRIEGGRKTALFDSADIYMQPGRQIGDQCEGFGITYIEAGLHRLPSISGKAGGAPDAVQDGETGLVVDGENLNEVVIALQGLIDEPDRASHMGNAAYAQAQTLLWDRQIGEVLALT
ncbi:glycosyltransferase family 4 protein [Litorimonas haliclonae]|uniref:glycosyltransferase family 4 protein n=1 Tax=Litorimonas haliclonae TaxID=2081977 RepID=UPI0039F1238D